MNRDAAAIIDAFLAGARIAHRKEGGSRWIAQLSGEHKLTIPLIVTITAGRVLFESFFMRRPIENADRFFDLLLRRNMRAYGVHFALDAVGDVYLVGQHPAEGLSEAELDRIVGSILVESDGVFDAAVGIGFAGYLEADRAFRARHPDE